MIGLLIPSLLLLLHQFHPMWSKLLGVFKTTKKPFSDGVMLPVSLQKENLIQNRVQRLERLIKKKKKKKEMFVFLVWNFWIRHVFHIQEIKWWSKAIFFSFLSPSSNKKSLDIFNIKCCNVCILYIWMYVYKIHAFSFFFFPTQFLFIALFYFFMANERNKKNA